MSDFLKRPQHQGNVTQQTAATPQPQQQQPFQVVGYSPIPHDNTPMRNLYSVSRTPFTTNRTSGGMAQHGIFSNSLLNFCFKMSATAPVAPLEEAPRLIVHGSDKWVTIFGFPKEYQDGVLRYFRAIGEIQEIKKGGDNWIGIRQGIFFFIFKKMIQVSH